MRDAVLAIVGTIGIAALVMSMNKEKNQIREDFNGMQLRNRLDKTVKNNKNSDYVHAIPVDKDPLIKCGSNVNSKTVENKSTVLVNALQILFGLTTLGPVIIIGV